MTHTVSGSSTLLSARPSPRAIAEYVFRINSSFGCMHHAPVGPLAPGTTVRPREGSHNGGYMTIGSCRLCRLGNGT